MLRARTLSAILSVLALCVLAQLALVEPTSATPPRWSWPETPENLEVLPADFPPERLRAVMTGFTRALGVRCSHCHVGEEGQPLSAYDFPSDDNPNKETAREMLRMLGTINDHLEKIEPTGYERVNMWCHTCHRGRPRPTSLGEELDQAFRTDGVGAIASHYQELRDAFEGRGTLDFSSRELIRLGYEYLDEGELEAAIAAFRVAVDQHPDDFNNWDSLAEAYLKADRRELARIYYRKSLELNPDNGNALQMLEQLRHDPE